MAFDNLKFPNGLSQMFFSLDSTDITRCVIWKYKPQIFNFGSCVQASSSCSSHTDKMYLVWKIRYLCHAHKSMFNNTLEKVRELKQHLVLNVQSFLIVAADSEREHILWKKFFTSEKWYVEDEEVHMWECFDT